MFAAPAHPYTRALAAAFPVIGDPAFRRKKLGGLWDYLAENKDYPYYLIRDRFAGRLRGSEPLLKGL